MEELNSILRAATEDISDAYFQLPIQGREQPLYRERVYCYELYHQMRRRWPDPCRFSLGGEVDKSGHPLIRGNGLDRTKPDLIVHVPGDMGGNHAVIEVKPKNCAFRGLRKDIMTLRAFRDHAGYDRQILLVYGEQYAARAVQRVERIAEGEGANWLSRVELWIHAFGGAPAEHVATW